MADGATPHRTTAQDSNRMPRPVRVLFVRCAVFRPLTSASLSTGFFQKVAYHYKYCSANRSLWRPTFGSARCAKRQQVAISAGVVAPLVCKSFFVAMMSAFCISPQITLETGHAPPRHAGPLLFRDTSSSVLVICEPISRLRIFFIWLFVFWFLHTLTHTAVGNNRRSRCISTGIQEP